MSKVKAFMKSVPGKILGAALICTAGAVGQELKMPFLSEVVRALVASFGG